MPQLLIPDFDHRIMERLRERASLHGRTVETEARAILEEAIRGPAEDPWAAVDLIRNRLAATGRDFGDSTDLIREGRDR